MTLLKILSLCLIINLSGCAIPLKITYENSINENSVKFYRPEDSAQVIIKAIIIEGGLSESQAMNLWQDYRRSVYKDLSAFLIATNYFTKIYGRGLRDDLYIELVKLVKARTKILKRGYYAKK